MPLRKNSCKGGEKHIMRCSSYHWREDHSKLLSGWDYCITYGYSQINVKQFLSMHCSLEFAQRSCMCLSKSGWTLCRLYPAKSPMLYTDHCPKNSQQTTVFACSRWWCVLPCSLFLLAFYVKFCRYTLKRTVYVLHHILNRQWRQSADDVQCGPFSPAACSVSLLLHYKYSLFFFITIFTSYMQCVNRKSRA